MAEEGFDAYLVTSGVSIFYFSHFYHMVTERPAALLVEPDGKPTFTGKIGYGQCFAVYAFSEYSVSYTHLTLPTN